MAVANLIKFYCVVYPTWWTAIMQKWYALEKGPWSYASMKKLLSFFLPINYTYYSRCGVLAFLFLSSCQYTHQYTHGVVSLLPWLQDMHTTVCLDSS